MSRRKADGGAGLHSPQVVSPQGWGGSGEKAGAQAVSPGRGPPKGHPVEVEGTRVGCQLSRGGSGGK